MKISRLLIKNYRCLDHVDISLNDYTAFVGPNGAGKSSILYALEWFFDQRNAYADDLNWSKQATSFEIKVVISDLSASATRLLGKFGRDGRAEFTRRYDSLGNSTEYVGRVLCGPGFQEVLEMDGIARIRSAYSALQDRFPELPELTGNYPKSAIEEAFEIWESDPANRDRLEEISSADARTMFLPNGAVSQIVQFILVKGATDLASQLEATGRASTLHILTEKLVNTAKQNALTEWKISHSKDIEELEAMTEEAVESAMAEHQIRINRAISNYLPDTEISLRSSRTRVTIMNDAPISSRIRSNNGEERDVTSQGHGTQRAVMMAIVQSLAEAKSSETEEGQLLVIAAEEPEIFQHPVRIRHFSRALSKLAESAECQVLVATHSSYFIRPEHLHSIRKVQLVGHASSITWASPEQIAKRLNKTDYELLRRMEKEIPGTFSECFFAQCVVLVEGDTDKALLEAVADQLNKPFEQVGIHIFPVGSKTDFKFYYEILTSFGINPFVIFDGDASAAEKHVEEEKRAAARASHFKQTMECLKLLEMTDESGAPTSYQFGDPTWIGTEAVIFQDCIETEAKLWKSFCSEMSKLYANLDGKNAHAYRLAAQRADPSQVPETLLRTIEKIHDFAKVSEDVGSGVVEA